MESLSKILIMFVVFFACGIAFAGQVNLNAPVVDKPTVGSELKRGMDVANECSSQLFVDPLKLSSCAFDAQERNAQKHSNHQFYDVGLFFQTWLNEDILYRSALDLSKTNEI